MMVSLDTEIRPRLTSAGLELARRYSWQRTAEAHLATYLDMTEPAHA